MIEVESELVEFQQLMECIALTEQEIHERLYNPVMLEAELPRPCAWQNAVPLGVRHRWHEMDMGIRLRIIQQASQMSICARESCPFRQETNPQHECAICQMELRHIG